MATKFEAADTIRRLAKLYEHMAEAADTLEKIGSIEQATKEAEKARDAAAKERDASAAELRRTKDEIKAAKEVAREKALDAEIAARQKAEKIVSDAENKAAEILDAANKSSVQALDNAETILAELNRQIETARNQLADVSAQMRIAVEARMAAEDELATIIARRDEMKAQIAKFLN